MKKYKILIASLFLVLLSCQGTRSVGLPSIEITSTLVKPTFSLASPTPNLTVKGCFEKATISQNKNFEGTIFFANQNNIYRYSNMELQAVEQIDTITSVSRSPNNQTLAVLDSRSGKILLLESDKLPISLNTHPMISDYIRWQSDQKLFYIINATDGEPFKYFEFNISSMEGVEKSPWTTNMYPKIEFSPLENKYVDLAFSPELASDRLLLIDLSKLRVGWAIELNDPQNAIYRWSPDGQKILLVDKKDISDENYAIYTVDIVDGTKDILVDNLPQASLLLSEPSWSPDMKNIIFWGKDKNNHISLYILNIETLEVTDLELSMSDYWNPTWSPDSLYLTFSSKNDFLILNVANREKYLIGSCNLDILGWTLP